jgi:hypothetical protein
MQKPCLAAVTLLVLGAAAPPALAQDGGITASAGLRAWYTSWTTFTYILNPNDADEALGLGQKTADPRLVVMPSLGLRWRDWSATVSALPSTTYDLPGGTGSRQEYDITFGWSLMPGLIVNAGYKRVLQREGAVRYEPKGLVLGLSGTAGIEGPWALYGNVAVGRLRTSGPATKTNVSFETDYRAAEVGIGYTVVSGAWGVKRWTVTGGYRLQVLGSREAFGPEAGRDETNGFTFGVIAAF